MPTAVVTLRGRGSAIQVRSNLPERRLHGVSERVSLFDRGSSTKRDASPATPLRSF